MLTYSFSVYGHKNILATHKRTIEFTKDSDLTKEGDCILGVRADFSLKQLLNFVHLNKIRITIAVDNLTDTLTAIPNKNFNSDKELVIRLGEFASERTFATRADKSSFDVDRKLVGALKKGSEGTVTISA